MTIRMIMQMKRLRSVCLPGLLHMMCAVILASGLLPLVVHAATIANSASASFTDAGGQPVVMASNTTSLLTVPPPSPSTVTFYQYAPGAAGSSPIAFDGGQFDDTGSGGFLPLPSPMDLDGNTLSLAAPVEVKPTHVFHAGEPVFITLTDLNRNIDPAVREIIEVRLSSSTGDSEILRLQETGPDTGIFAAVIQSVSPAQPVTALNGMISVATNSTLTVDYQDAIYPPDTSATDALVDPFGVVFDSDTGLPVDGATVTMINTVTGLPAQVFGDDGVSAYPATVVTGGTATDSGGTGYTFPAGGFRFPFVRPGSYRFVVMPPGAYVAPSTVAPGSLPSGPSGPYAIVAGSYGDVFVVVPGPALNIDIPVDPQSPGLVVQKTVSQTQASAGDFLQYRLTIRNTDAVVTANATTLTDRLPFGMKYQAGSLVVNGVKQPDPAIAADGRTLTMALGNLAPSSTSQITYVVLLGAGVAVGDAVNTAQAMANAGVMVSNVATVAVRIKEPLFSGRFTIIGRVYEGDCTTPWDKLRGVANARLMMEDGTYVVTDADGQYHFEGVRPGTHVVQLDVETLPGGLEPVSCIDNTRFAGRNFSQFVDVKGGGLWRADFHTKARTADIGLRMQSRLDVTPAKRMTEVNTAKTFTLKAEFDSCSTVLKPEGEAEVARLVQELAKQDVERIELTGHTDNQRLSLRCQKQFNDNHVLSKARAEAVGLTLAEGLGLRQDQIVFTGRGPDVPLADNHTAVGMAKNRRTDVKVFMKETAPLTRESSAAVQGLAHRIEVDGAVAVENLKVMAMLAQGTIYQPGSAKVDGKPVPDPYVAGGVANFTLGKVEGDWKHVVEFAARPEKKFEEAPESTPGTYTLHAQFASCRAELSSAVKTDIARLARELRDQDISAIELVGHTDNQRLSPRCQTMFVDNKALSQARASAVGGALAKALGLRADQVTAAGRGDEQPVADNASAAGMAKNRRTDVIVHHRNRLAMPTLAPTKCPQDPYLARALARFEATPGASSQTPAAENRLMCPQEALHPSPASAAESKPFVSVSDESDHVTVAVQRAVRASLPADMAERQTIRQSILDDVAASGAETDWFAMKGQGTAWLFPSESHNPRTPAVRVVIRHAAGQVVVLRDGKGEKVSPLNFDGTQIAPDRRSAVSIWRGVPVNDGANRLEAEILSSTGERVETLLRVIHYANAPVRAELVPEQSILMADGINRPVIAVRLLDRDGRPVRAGVTGPIEINAPFVAWEQVKREQERQLAGMERFQPHYQVEGDDGIAYLELAPTTESGAVILSLNFQIGSDTTRRQEVRAWMEPRARDWVVVGFAEGTVGYNTLKDNVQPLLNEGVEEGGWSDGQISLYAKGRVLGKWLLTMAYDSDKTRDRRGLLSTIDPNEYYTLYGDGAEQRYDAPSQAKLYLKLERGQFYALFGDYETGLSQTQLSRYSRTLNGIKMENAGGPVNFVVFAAETPQNFTRDEIQGDGTSGLYRLSNNGIVLNSEQIRIEVRDRLHSQNILQTRTLSRHLDYDIDYSAGTLFFRQPVNSRDTNFNPTFIVAEYETLGVADEHLNMGGRIAVDLKKDKVTVGVSSLRDENNLGTTDLAGADVKVKLATDTELRVEAAVSDGQQGVLSPEGDAWLAELEHHTGRVDALLYARRQDSGFGVGQQSGSDSGQQKLGVDGQIRLDANWSVQGQVYNQENLNNADTRDAVMGKLQYKTDRGGVGVGAQVINDRAGSGLLAGQDFRSEQASVAANRFFFNRKLELTAQADTALGGNSDSIDFPNRYVFGAGYAITDSARLLIGQELTDGGSFDTSTTRAGLQVVPWKGARLDSTLNQSRMGENGPRTFGQFGLTQAVLVNDNWGLDFSADSSNTFNESGNPAPVINPAHPVTSGGTLNTTGVTEDFYAFSAGATYRQPVWSWNGRAETRNGETTDRYGVVSNFLRQAQAGIAFASSAELFRTEQSSGTEGVLASLDLSWAWRPLGVQWSVLDRLEFRFEEVESGSGAAGSGLFGNTSLVANNASTRRIINNLAVNRVSREWTEKDRQGNLFRRYERNQWSLYYGAKYALDSFDGEEYSGYTDLMGVEVRHDIKRWLDVGVQASSLNAWSAGTHAYSVGPMVGVSPVTNGWITLGYNFRGFTDRDFDAARYTAAGPYLQLRFKFDQNSFGRQSKTTETTMNTVQAP